MSWQALLAARSIQAHQTSQSELDDLRAVVARDLNDAAITALSADRRFATAYNAVLQLAKTAIACAGYRVTAKQGHHAISFEAAELALGPAAANLTAYFDACRIKRNQVEVRRGRRGFRRRGGGVAAKGGGVS